MHENWLSVKGLMSICFAAVVGGFLSLVPLLCYPPRGLRKCKVVRDSSRISEAAEPGGDIWEQGSYTRRRAALVSDKTAYRAMEVTRVPGPVSSRATAEAEEGGGSGLTSQ